MSLKDISAKNLKLMYSITNVTMYVSFSISLICIFILTFIAIAW